MYDDGVSVPHDTYNAWCLYLCKICCTLKNELIEGVEVEYCYTDEEDSNWNKLQY